MSYDKGSPDVVYTKEELTYEDGASSIDTITDLVNKGRHLAFLNAAALYGLHHSTVRTCANLYA